MSVLKFVTPGLMTSLQDRGRNGFLRYGVPVCGALDFDSLRIANALLGNNPDTPGLEIRYLGPGFVVMARRVRIAVSGAAVSMKVDRGDETFVVHQDRTCLLTSGDRVSVGQLRDSSTAYLAVEGGFAVQPVLGSASTDLKSSIGGWRGSNITAGTELRLNIDSVPEHPDMTITAARELVSADPIRVVLGPQQDYFTEAALELFVSTEWKISQNADRMGMRLEGPELDHAKGFNIASDGIANGAVQVPGNRQPIVLLADRQTSGGYPKIATIISSDLARLGRLGPGATLRFDWITAADGVEAARMHEAQLQEIIDSITPYHAPGEIDQDALAAGNIISPPVGMD